MKIATQISHANPTFARLNSIQQKIILAASAAGMGMVLLPPKAITVTNPILGITEGQHYGYVFLFDTPAMTVGSGLFANPYLSFHIEWRRLLIQLAVLGIVTFFAVKSQESKI